MGKTPQQPRVTPQEAWERFREGNQRFILGTREHPNQDAPRRAELTTAQSPDVALFGCADSRLAAEIIFDCGLGDLFVARNMGHVVAESIVASMEYAVTELGVALIIVLAHDSCGAVKAAIKQSTKTPSTVTSAVASTLRPILPAVQQEWHQEHQNTPYVDAAQIDADAVGRRHLAATVNELLRESRIIADAVDGGALAVVGVQYSLAEGRAVPYIKVGTIEIDTEPVAGKKPANG